MKSAINKESLDNLISIVKPVSVHRYAMQVNIRLNGRIRSTDELIITPYVNEKGRITLGFSDNNHAYHLSLRDIIFLENYITEKEQMGIIPQGLYSNAYKHLQEICTELYKNTYDSYLFKHFLIHQLCHIG